MKSKKILHISTAEKFIQPFIEFLDKHLDISEHEFRLVEGGTRFPIAPRSNIYFPKKGWLNKLSNYAELVLAMHQADKIILHGLFRMRVIQVLWLMPWLLKKSYWVMWGGDLYRYEEKDNYLRWIRKEFFRYPVIKRMGNFVSLVRGDYELAQQWYGAKGHFHQCIIYPSNLFKVHQVQPKNGASINLLVGNSSDPSNNHFEIFEQLVTCQNADIRIYCPLSYGNDENAKRVAERGRVLFGDKFVPLMEFMSFEKYLELLSQIDIAIFAHKRQQALGNTITLLGLGKTVFMRSDVTHWNFLEEIGLTLCDINTLHLNLIDDEDRSNNILQVKSFFSEANLVKQLEDLFCKSN